MKRYGTVIIVASLAGCVTLDPATVSTKSTPQVCYSWAVARVGNSDNTTAATAYDELLRRQAFSKRDLDMIRSHGRPMPGMTEGAAICAWGGSYDTVNTTTTASGTTRQFIERFETGYTRYFYTRNGIVTAVQD
ncbi:hypothetical protein [Microcystis phage Mae-JY02]